MIITFEKKTRIEFEVYADDPKEAVRIAEALGFKPIIVDGKEVHSVCENCNAIITEGDGYYLTADCVVLCHPCKTDLEEDFECDE